MRKPTATRLAMTLKEFVTYMELKQRNDEFHNSSRQRSRYGIPDDPGYPDYIERSVEAQRAFDDFVAEAKARDQ